jgi:hypothetical protein
MKVESDEWASVKRVKILLRYIEVKKFCPVRCVEGFHVALRHRAMAKEVPMATGSLYLLAYFMFCDKLDSYDFDLIVY